MNTDRAYITKTDPLNQNNTKTYGIAFSKQLFLTPMIMLLALIQCMRF